MIRCVKDSKAISYLFSLPHTVNSFSFFFYSFLLLPPCDFISFLQLAFEGHLFELQPFWTKKLNLLVLLQSDDLDGEIDLTSCVRVSDCDIEKNYGLQIQVCIYSTSFAHVLQNTTRQMGSESNHLLPVFIDRLHLL